MNVSSPLWPSLLLILVLQVLFTVFRTSVVASFLIGGLVACLTVGLLIKGALDVLEYFIKQHTKKLLKMRTECAESNVP